jgi:hypothetical protein
MSGPSWQVVLDQSANQTLMVPHKSRTQVALLALGALSHGLPNIAITIEF